jgi:endonuclease/exonuclease/phosphatase family metal-dependent hydrolase
MRLLIILCVAGCADPEPEPLHLTVMTFNVMCSFCGDGHFDDDEYDDWETRLPHLLAAIERQKPDLIGVQELFYTAPVAARGIRDEVADLGGRGPLYRSIYFLRDPDVPTAIMDNPDATILYRADRFKARRSGSFWLSPTPDIPFSTGFDPDGQLARLVIWAELEEINSGRRLLFATTHVDNNSPSQELSAPVIRSRLKALAGDLPLIVVGDFNAGMDHAAYRDLIGDADYPLSDTYSAAAAPRAIGSAERIDGYAWRSRIDHIFSAPAAAFAVDDWVIDLTRYAQGSRAPSDHRAITASLRLQR